MKTQQVRNGRPRLSVAIIARNEQEVIAETLDSILAIADEIIVWDSGSEDETMSLARKKGVKVFQGFWKNDFSAARNDCLSKVSGDWVLWLDAGEKLADPAAKKIRDFIDSAADPQKAYLIMVEIPPADNCTAGEQIAQPRLLPAKAGLKFEGRLRETLYPSIQAAGLKIDTAPGLISRHPRQHSQVRKTRLANRDLGLVELELIDGHGPNPRLFLAQGEAYINLGSYDRAREAFIKAIELSDPGSSEMLEGYYGLLTGYNYDPDLRDTQMRVCLNALEVFPLDFQLLLAVGSYFQIHNRLDLATRAFETAVKFGQTNSSIWHLCELPEVSASCLSIALQLQGKDEEARRALEEALDRHPQSARLLRLAINSYIKTGNAEQGIEVAQRGGMLSSREDPLILAIRGACKAAKQEWTPALTDLQSAYLMGCRSTLCLRWLAVALLSNGQAGAAKPVLDVWQKLEPANPELQAYIAAVRETQNAPCIKTEKEAKAEEVGNVKTAVRQFRIDPGSTITEVHPIRIPFVHHDASSDISITEET
ncbi:MAG: glycosyltransferase [Thermoguttaceae bacterium]|jgi:glycosyltransferase involved in cell wall biosynthesis